MSTGITLPQYNLSVYKQYEKDAWKFLEPTDALGHNNLGYLIRSPYPVAIATVLYIGFVCFIGPLYMRNREPYKLKNVIRFYNLIMVILAAALFYRVHDAIDSFGSMIDCQKVFSFTDMSGTKIYQMADFIIMIRISEYLDTIFFTLRKKPNQITFLHVFHHSFVPLYAYWVIRTAPLRFNVYIIFVNSLIHVFMYFYYFIATFSEAPTGTKSNQSHTKKQSTSITMLIIQKLLLFKKYMTLMQIVQFVSLFFYAVWPMFMRNRCNIPDIYITANIMLALGFLILFTHFYAYTYKRRASMAAAAAKRQD